MTRTVPIVAALCVAAAPAAALDLKFSNKSGATVTFYGQINLVFQFVDDGTDSYSDFVDNSNSVSRLGFRVEMPVGGNKLTFNAEVGLGLKNTADTSQTDDGDWIDWQRTDIRKFEVSYSGGFGTLWLGQGSMATDGAAEIDNSGTAVIGYGIMADTAGGYEFRSDGVLSGITVGDTFKDFDGSRRMRIRYDTPSLSGFTLSAAYGQDVLSESDEAEYYDAAVRYKLDGETIGIDSALGYSWKDDDGSNTEYLIGSATFTHKPSGASLTVAAGDNQTGDGSYYYAKLGWKGRVVKFGHTAVSIDYYDGADFEVDGSSSQAWGIQAVQAFDDLQIEALLGYRAYSFSAPGADYHDLDTLLVGARWRF